MSDVIIDENERAEDPEESPKYLAKFSRKPADVSQEEFEALCMGLGGQDQCVRLTQGICQKPCSLSDDGITYTVQWDHIVPRALGGKSTRANLQPLCDIPNAIKQAKPDEYWESSRFFFDIDNKPNREKLRPGQIEFAWKPAIRLAEAMLSHNADIYRVYLLLWWIVGGGKTISMPILCSAINTVILEKGHKGTPRINKLLILTKEAALRDSIARELETELVGYGIYRRKPEVRIVNAWDKWGLPGYIDRADIVVACVHQLWEIERDKPRNDQQVARILSNFGAIGIDEIHFGAGQLERLKNLSPRSLKFGFSNTPINDLGEILDSFVMLSMLDYQYGLFTDDSLKILTPFQDGLNNGLYVPVQPEKHKTMVCGIEGDEQDGIHADPLNIWSEKNVCVAVIKRLQELDRTGRSSAPDDWFSSHALIRADNVKAGEEICRQINSFLNDNRPEFPVSDGWRATLLHGELKNGPAEERRLTHPEASKLKHPWMRAKSLPKGRCDKTCARILVVVDMVREGANNCLCNVIGWTCASTSLIELIQRIGRAMRAIPNMNRKILLRHQSVHLFWHAGFEENAPAIRRAIEWMLSMPLYGAEMPTLDDLLDDGEIETDIQKGKPESVLTPEDKSDIEHVIGQQILSGTKPKDIDIDWIIDHPGVLRSPVSKERRKSAKEFGRILTSNSPEKEKRLGVRQSFQPISVICYEKPKESYTDEDLIRFIDTDMDYTTSEEDKEAMRNGIKTMPFLRRDVESRKRKNDAIFSTAMPTPSQSLTGSKKSTGNPSVISEISALYASRLKGLVVPEEKINPGKDDLVNKVNFIRKYVTTACHVILGTPSLTQGDRFDRIEYHTRLKSPKIDQKMFEMVRLQLMIDGHLPVLRAVYEDQVLERINAGMTLRDFRMNIGKAESVLSCEEDCYEEA